MSCVQKATPAAAASLVGINPVGIHLAGMAKPDAAGQLHLFQRQEHRLLHHKLQPPGDAHHTFKVKSVTRSKDNDQTAILQRKKRVTWPQSPPKPGNAGRSNLRLPGSAKPVTQIGQVVELQNETAGLPPVSPPVAQGRIQAGNHLIRHRNPGGMRQKPAAKQHNGKAPDGKGQQGDLSAQPERGGGQCQKEKPRIRPPHHGPQSQKSRRHSVNPAHSGPRQDHLRPGLAGSG